ncbi:Type IV leader peptidase family protein [Loktanella sp. DSM 29012]|uniref:prepilin peptidase n=1 Tax=Loktanella sp. DSM 29012 TaxID=1881056 RepID=UPI0008BB53B4|nr:prepilin peptidase [Loktanella sp. DSM 29012]SEQ36071.1 Type IV leader peptidase family protein [Loktanella sp. DSM 29012]
MIGLPDPTLLSLGLALAVALISTWIIWTDISARRISNAAVAALAAVWLIAALFLLPWFEVLRGLGLAIAVFVVGVLIYQKARIGGGDIKLLCATLALVPSAQFWNAVWVFYGLLVLHVVISLIVSGIALKSIRKSWQNVRQYPLGVPLAGVLLVGALRYLASA